LPGAARRRSSGLHPSSTSSTHALTATRPMARRRTRPPRPATITTSATTLARHLDEQGTPGAGLPLPQWVTLPPRPEGSPPLLPCQRLSRPIHPGGRGSALTRLAGRRGCPLGWGRRDWQRLGDEPAKSYQEVHRRRRRAIGLYHGAGRRRHTSGSISSSAKTAGLRCPHLNIITR
jgi:hypothetical protein